MLLDLAGGAGKFISCLCSQDYQVFQREIARFRLDEPASENGSGLDTHAETKHIKSSTLGGWSQGKLVDSHPLKIVPFRDFKKTTRLICCEWGLFSKIYVPAVQERTLQKGNFGGKRLVIKPLLPTVRDASDT
jgi:hypothetical protein